jgi:UDP-N-acetylmuramate dehydrogenase
MSAAYERGMKGEIYQEEELREKLLLVEELKALGIRLRSGVPARDLTTVRVGGPIHALYQIPTIEAMQAFMRHCCDVGQEMHRPQVLGAGSNSLFPDEGFFSPLIRLAGDFKSFSELKEGVFQVGGAVGLMRLARAVSEQGYSGLEFAGGIPGSFGGAVFMNAGAHGGEIGNVIKSVRVVLPDGELCTLAPEQLQFRYRSCTLPEGAVVVDAVIALVRGDPQRVKGGLTRNLEYRKQTQPLSLPSFGSTFRNPTSDPEDSTTCRSAGELIEEAGLKGRVSGGAEVSSLHANWIVNPARTATTADICSLMSEMAREVYEKSGVDLEPEVVDWGKRDRYDS